MEPEIKIFPTPVRLAEEFAVEFACMINDSAKMNEPFTVALSGGSTPDLLFSLIGEGFAGKVKWDHVQFFWGDERCVPPGSKESNFGSAFSKMLTNIEIPYCNIHRIKAEEDPEKEAIRYSAEISANTRNIKGVPVFDLILLGLGEDGHTASIFPGDMGLLVSEKICEVAVHPVSQQKRITITGKVINNADEIIFLVTGKKKAEIVNAIFTGNPLAKSYPAANVVPVHGKLRWFLDQDAAILIDK